jgi:hypothetical protein
MFNVTNLPGIDNPRWPIGNATETIKVPSAGQPFPYDPATRLVTAADALLSATAIAVAWLIGLPRRAGSHLYAMNDEEARWHHWQVTETLGGLGRQYREPAFEALKADPTLRSDELECPLGGKR